MHSIADASAKSRDDLATILDLTLVKTKLSAAINEVSGKIDLVEQRILKTVYELHADTLRESRRTLIAIFGIVVGVGGLVVAAVKLL